jgi:hypothetical protein
LKNIVAAQHFQISYYEIHWAIVKWSCPSRE